MWERGKGTSWGKGARKNCGWGVMWAGGRCQRPLPKQNENSEGRNRNQETHRSAPASSANTLTSTPFVAVALIWKRSMPRRSAAAATKAESPARISSTREEHRWPARRSGRAGAGESSSGAGAGAFRFGAGLGVFCFGAASRVAQGAPPPPGGAWPACACGAAPLSEARELSQASDA